MHDAAIRERDEQLATWVADCDYALGRECTALRQPLGGDDAKVQPLEPGADDSYGDWHDSEKLATKQDCAIADARALALHEYRDQERLTKIDRLQVLASEGWAHRAYRKLPLFRHHPIPVLTTPDRAVPVLNAWRKQSSMSSSRPTWPDDATKRTLEHAIANVRTLGP
jgi:hypothetical protein